MKTSTLSSLFLAGIILVMPAILSAQVATNALSTPSQTSYIEVLRASVGYPKLAVQKNIQGKFAMLVNVDENGKATMVNFEVTSESEAVELTPLIRAAEAKIYAFNFGQEFAGQTVRVPFNFRLF